MCRDFYNSPLEIGDIVRVVNLSPNMIRTKIGMLGKIIEINSQGNPEIDFGDYFSTIRGERLERVDTKGKYKMQTKDFNKKKSNKVVVTTETPDDLTSTIKIYMQHFVCMEDAHKYIEEQLKANPNQVFEIYTLSQIAKIPSQVRYFDV